MPGGVMIPVLSGWIISLNAQISSHVTGHVSDVTSTSRSDHRSYITAILLVEHGISGPVRGFRHFILTRILHIESSIRNRNQELAAIREFSAPIGTIGVRDNVGLATLSDSLVVTPETSTSALSLSIFFQRPAQRSFLLHVTVRCRQS